MYKAEDLLYEHYHNDWDLEAEDEGKWLSPPLKKRRTDDLQSSSAGDFRERRQRTGPQFVAIKKIYVTSSPMRIQNELELLHDLRGCKHVCPLITAFRHQDQVVAVLPYFRHLDFRVRCHGSLKALSVTDTARYISVTSQCQICVFTSDPFLLRSQPCTNMVSFTETSSPRK